MTKAMRILLIEDDREIRAYVKNGLLEAGHAVDDAAEGKDGLFLATTESYDVMIIDRMLPGLDGLTIVKTVRGAGNTTPILILSALSQVDDRVKGLRAGGDDYLVKPFSFAELLARVEVLSRRGEPKNSRADTVLSCGDLQMDLLGRRVTRGGALIDLQAREFALLEYMLRHKGQVVTRTMLLENVWDYNFDPQTNVIDVHVSRLRAKIARPGDEEAPLIRTIRGAGYIIDDR